MTYYPDQWARCDPPPSPLDIELDDQNPRLSDAARSSPTTMREEMLERQAIIELASQIIEFKGLLPNESILLHDLQTSEGKRYTVLEGNRRVLACQILLKPELAGRFKPQVPVPDDQTSANIRTIEAKSVISRPIAEQLCTAQLLSGKLRS